MEQANLKTAQSITRYLRTTPRKIRAIADIIRGLPLAEAEAQLVANPRRASGLVLKALRSAAANAEVQKMDRSKLFVKTIFGDQGPMLKRFLPRARGSASEIQKKMCHLTVILAENPSLASPRFKFAVRKKAKSTPGSPVAKSKARASKPKAVSGTSAEKPKEGNIVKRVFSRKTAAGE